MASFACSCRYLFIADIRKVSISEGIVAVKPCPSLSAPRSPLDRRVSSSLETIVVGSAREGDTRCQYQHKMVVSQLSGQTFDDLDQILQVCCELVKFTRRPIPRKLAHSRSSLLTKHPPGSEITSLELWVMLHPIAREMGNESRTVLLKALSRIPFQKA